MNFILVLTIFVSKFDIQAYKQQFITMFGRPCSKLEINFNQIDKSVEQIKCLLTGSDSTRQKVQKFAQALNSVLFESTDSACQTNEISTYHASCQQSNLCHKK